jgi:hypothetical protein
MQLMVGVKLIKQQIFFFDLTALHSFQAGINVGLRVTITRQFILGLYIHAPQLNLRDQLSTVKDPVNKYLAFIS